MNTNQTGTGIVDCIRRKRKPHINLESIDHQAAIENAKKGLCEAPPTVPVPVVKKLEGQRPTALMTPEPVAAQKADVVESTPEAPATEIKENVPVTTDPEANQAIDTTATAEKKTDGSNSKNDRKGKK